LLLCASSTLLPVLGDGGVTGLQYVSNFVLVRYCRCTAWDGDLDSLLAFGIAFSFVSTSELPFVRSIFLLVDHPFSCLFLAMNHVFYC
jgi:hypothetical protein